MIWKFMRTCDPYRALAVTILAVGAIGCSNGSTPTDSLTGPTPALVTETFNGSIRKNGVDVHTFSVTSSGNTLLAGFTSISPSSVTSLGLGLGAWDSATSTCGLNLSQSETARSGSTALNGTADTGSYCLRAYDTGSIPDDTTVDYVVQVQHY